MLRRVYVETTIPSFYHERRQEPEMIARREWTRDWWDNHASQYELVASFAVVEELESGDHPAKPDALRVDKRMVRAFCCSVSVILVGLTSNYKK